MLLVYVFLLAMLPSIAHAATYYVTPSGGQGGCSTNTNSPQNGLNNGIACLSSGDTLVLKSGTYDARIPNTIPSGSSGAPTILRAEVPRTAIIRPSGSSVNIVVTQGSYITFDGLVVDGAATSAPIIGMLIGVDGSDGLHILNVEVRNIPNANFCSTGNNSQGLGFGQIQNGILRNSHIHHIGYDAVPDPGNCPSGQHYFYSYCLYSHIHNSLIENNELDHCSSYSIHGYNTIRDNVIRNNYIHDNGGPLLVCEAGNNQVYNNIVANNPGTYAGGSGGIVVGGFCSGSIDTNAQVYNNTIVSNGGPCVQFGVSGAGMSVNSSFARNNICRGNVGNGGDILTVQNGSGNTINTNLCSTAGVGCTVVGDPLFVNPGAGDYHVQTGSPAIGAGVNLSSSFTTDYAGTTRTPPWTIGAYQFGGASLPAPTNFRVMGN